MPARPRNDSNSAPGIVVWQDLCIIPTATKPGRPVQRGNRGQNRSGCRRCRISAVAPRGKTARHRCPPARRRRRNNRMRPHSRRERARRFPTSTTPLPKPTKSDTQCSRLAERAPSHRNIGPSLTQPCVQFSWLTLVVARFSLISRCTHRAHAAFQLIENPELSVQSIMGAVMIAPCCDGSK